MASVISSPGSEYSESSVFSYGSIESAITDISITSPTDGPKSLKSQDAASKLFSAVDFQLNSIPPSAEKFDLDISYREVRWELKLSAKERLLIFPYAEPFIDQLSSKSRNSSKSSTPALAASFLQYLCGQEDSIEATQIVLHAFEKQFLPGTDIHSLAHGLDQSSQTVLLKGMPVPTYCQNSPAMSDTDQTLQGTMQLSERLVVQWLLPNQLSLKHHATDTQIYTPYSEAKAQ